MGTLENSEDSDLVPSIELFQQGLHYTGLHYTIDAFF